MIRALALIQPMCAPPGCDLRSPQRRDRHGAFAPRRLARQRALGDAARVLLRRDEEGSWQDGL